MSSAAVIVALVRHSFRRRRGLLLSIGVTVVAFQIFMVLAARNLEEAGGFRQIEVLLPAFMKQWSNMMAASFAGFVLFAICIRWCSSFSSRPRSASAPKGRPKSRRDSWIF